MQDVTLEPIYRMRTPGSRIVGWAFIAFAIILTIVIILDGGFGDLTTGIGFIVGAAVYGYLMYLLPHLRTDARGVTAVGPFTTTHIPWTDFAGVVNEWGLKLQTMNGKTYTVHAYPSTGAFKGRKEKGENPEFLTTGDFTLYLTKRPAVSLVADQLHFYKETKVGIRRLKESAFKRETHSERIIIAIIAAAAFLANLYAIIA